MCETFHKSPSLNVAQQCLRICGTEVAMNRKRLALMAEMLDEIARGTWRVSRIGFARQDARIPSFLPDVWITGLNEPLGSAACAIGYACLDSRFEGLRLDNMEPCTLTPPRPGRFTRRYVRGWDAVCTYFDLDLETAQSLFGPDGNPASPGIVRDWVLDLIDRPLASCRTPAASAAPPHDPIVKVG